RDREYSPAEAIGLIKGMQTAKFPETVEVHIRTGLNVRHADEQLRGTLALPHGLGKEVKIAVFAKGDKAREAEQAGADIVGDEDLAKKIEEGFTDFDVAIATPDMMPVVGRLGRRVLPLAVDVLEARAIALAALCHGYWTSTPIERAVPSMILDA
ncbi:MAG TPA: hypothetical protein VE270_00360, partial [Thermoleophilaceae bacterium]|nr:hypothetical protein [Thermoleophilaceae bacterium]